MGQVQNKGFKEIYTPMELYINLNNTAMLKGPNSSQEKMCSNFATRMWEVKLHGNRS